MIFLAGSEASGKTKKAFAYGWRAKNQRGWSSPIFTAARKEGDVEDAAEHVRAGGAFQDRN